MNRDDIIIKKAIIHILDVVGRHAGAFGPGAVPAARIFTIFSGLHLEKITESDDVKEVQLLRRTRRYWMSCSSLRLNSLSQR